MMFGRNPAYWLILALAVVSAIAVAIDLDSTLRAPILLAFLFWAPGSALWELSEIVDKVQLVVLSVCTSVTIVSVTALLFLYAGIWSAIGIFVVTQMVTYGALLLKERQIHQPADYPDTEEFFSESKVG